MNSIRKYNFRLINKSDYYVNLFLTTNSKNVGYYQYVSKEENESQYLIKGISEEIKQNDSSYKLPNEEDLSFTSETIITGTVNSDNIISLKGYDTKKPYEVGSKEINGSIVNITEVNDTFIKYNMDNINYITNFNKNLYDSNYSTPDPYINSLFIFETIPVTDKYILSAELTNNNSDNIVVVLKNDEDFKNLPILSNQTKNTIKIDLEKDDIITIVLSSNTIENTQNSILSYKLIPEEIDNENNYQTIYYFGSGTLNKDNSLNDGFIYKSDVQHYDEKPIVNNYIDVERNAIPAYESLINLAYVGNINDFEEFFTI
jgi:hypothetical protein